MSKLVRFWLAGLPAFAVAVPLNYFLVSYAGWPKPVAYLAVLFCQVTVNFFLCRRFVFESAPGEPVWAQYGEFLGGIGMFRLLDWAAYTAAVEGLRFHYLAVQVTNVVLFSLLKYKFSEQLFRCKRKRGPSSAQLH